MEMKMTFPGGVRVDAAFNGYRIETDQPVDHGGSGLSPAPFDLFLASIGTCAAFYVLRFLQQRALPTADVSVVLKAVQDPERHMVSDIVLRVLLPEDFPLKYHRAIASAVDLCTVKRHLGQPPRLETVVEVGGKVAA